MEREQKSERLTDAEVRDKVVGVWDEINRWHRRLGERWWPAEGSDLRADHDAAEGFTPSFLAWTSLSIATDCMLTASAYALNFGPTLFSMQPLLHTALVGGAQTVWLLAPDDQTSRLERAGQLAKDSHLRHKEWADGLEDVHPGAIDRAELALARQRLADLDAGGKHQQVLQTRAIRRAAEHVYSSPTNGRQISAEVVSEWRGLSAVAHGLPWEQSNRPGRLASEQDGVRTTSIEASWPQLQGAFSDAYAFLETGWRLLDQRGSALPVQKPGTHGY